MSSTSNAHFSHNLFPSFLSTLSILLSTHLIHFLSHFLGHSIQCLLFLTASAIICWYLPTSDVHLSPDKIRKVRLLILYLLTSSLSKAFLLFMYTHEEVSHNSTSTIDILLSTILSALMISVFIKIKYFFINQEENLIQKMKDLMRERDEALKSSDEHKFLVTTLAHDSRNILNCLNSSLKFLEDGLDASNQNDQNIQEDLLCAKYCSTALLNFLNNCLETQKSLETKQQVTKLNLPELVERIQGIIRPAVQFKKLQTNLTIEENTPTYVYLNESSVVQIMLNLIYNAIKFTDRGSVNVKIGWKPLGSEASKANRLPLSSMNRNALQIKRKDSAKVISTELNRIDSSRNLSGNKGLIRGKLLIEVCDTGCGMPEDALKKLFQPFSQVTADISKKKQGTGLGLWLTKLLVEKISGQTKVTSRVGKGSTFTVLLECQALPDSVALSPRRDLYIEPVNNNNKTAMNVNVNASEPARKKGVLVGDSPVENFCIKNYMRNLKIDVIEEVMTLKDLVNYLKCNMDEELVIVCDERHLDTLSKLNKLNKKFLERKLVITVEDKKENYEKHCDIAGSQYVERPVRWYDFLKAVSGTVTPLENKLGHSF